MKAWIYLFFFLFAGSAMADEPSSQPPEGESEKESESPLTESEKIPATPCDGDSSKLCKDSTGSKSACLAANRDQISEGCRKFRAKMNNVLEHEGIKKACKDDSMVYCQDSKDEKYTLGSKGKVQACLKKNVEKLSTDCQAEVAR